MIKYINDNGEYFNGCVVIDNIRIFNPSHDELLLAGYQMIEVDNPEEEEVIDRLIPEKLYQLQQYDMSEAVNSIFMGIKGDVNEQGEQIYNRVWFGKFTRMGLRANIEDCVNTGIETITWSVGDNRISVGVDRAKVLLSKIETEYALNCYMVTEQHRANILKLRTTKEVEEYDFTQGYPKKLKFVI